MSPQDFAVNFFIALFALIGSLGSPTLFQVISENGVHFLFDLDPRHLWTGVWVRCSEFLKQGEPPLNLVAPAKPVPHREGRLLDVV